MNLDITMGQPDVTKEVGKAVYAKRKVVTWQEFEA